METKSKINFSTSDELWDEVIKFKQTNQLNNNNEAVEELLKKAILTKQGTGAVLSDYPVPDEVLSEIEKFRKNTPTFERKHSLPLSIFLDKKSGAFYTECHIFGEDFVKYSDPDAIIDSDPDLLEEQRANREIEENNFYFIQMVEDANKGRSFSDMIVEFDTSYAENKPLKILGGQHRNKAMVQAVKNKMNVYHGIKVYFNLTKDQKVEIMRIANTNINVADDLRDRLQEETLSPTGMLKEFARATGMLKEDDNFSDKRRYEEDFSPSVRMVRSFIVNFFEGTAYKGKDLDADAVEPYLCKSGQNIDARYLKQFDKFAKITGKFDDVKLIEAGKMFAKLHDMQYKKAENIKGTAKKEYKIKSFSLAVITSWAFAAGALQKFPERLKKLYSLPDLSGDDDPLNAKAMSVSKHPVFDANKNYRGLATRSDSTERGRLLLLFLEYSKSSKGKISEPMCNSAIETFHSNRDKIRSEENRKKAFG